MYIDTEQRSKQFLANYRLYKTRNVSPAGTLPPPLHPNVCKLISRGPKPTRNSRERIETRDRSVEAGRESSAGERLSGPGKTGKFRISSATRPKCFNLPRPPSPKREETKARSRKQSNCQRNKTIRNPRRACWGSENPAGKPVEIGLALRGGFRARVPPRGRMQRTHSVLLTARRQFSRSNCSPPTSVQGGKGKALCSVLLLLLHALVVATTALLPRWTALRMHVSEFLSHECAYLASFTLVFLPICIYNTGRSYVPWNATCRGIFGEIFGV